MDERIQGLHITDESQQIPTENRTADESQPQATEFTSQDIDTLLAQVKQMLCQSPVSDTPPVGYINSDEDTDPTTAPGHTAPEPNTNRPRKWTSRITGVAFYLVLIAVVAGIFSFMGNKGTGPKTLFGFSALNILTPSMQSEIPEGSLVLTHIVNPGTIQIGDDVTYMVSAKTSVTHKVIGIYENYRDSGMRYFQTKGVDNDAPDKELVAASNVLGKVVWHVPNVGRITSFISGNALLLFTILIIMGGLLYAIYATLRWLFRPQTQKELEQQAKKRHREAAHIPIRS